MINFRFKEKARKNKVFIEVMYCGGDADTDHPHIYQINIPFNKDMSRNEVIESEISELKILKSVLDDDDMDYESVLETYGSNIASMYDNAPNDPQSDYSRKCYISDVKLIGYDSDGDRYESYLSI